MNEQVQTETLPLYYRPRPHQAKAWPRRLSGKYNYYFKIDCRQSGKDTDDIEFDQDFCWWNPGTQAVYIGLDNVWIKENIWKKTLEDENGIPRLHWDNYPIRKEDIKPTEREVLYRNKVRADGTRMPDNTAPSRLKFIGFLNDKQLIGSSYRLWTLSEASLYKDDAWTYIQPIWENQEAEGKPFLINVNGTPRGIRNIYYDMLKTYTGEDDPERFPGEHGNCYVEKVTINDLYVPDGHGGTRRLYSEERIEQLKDRIMRQYGNLNLFYQEYMCEFLTVKAGLVYQAIEKLDREGRVRDFNIREDKPVYMAWDIASKGKSTDASVCIVFQYYEGVMYIYDYYKVRGKALVECLNDLVLKDYFRLVKIAGLPWDAERSASSATPKEEAERAYPHIRWHTLEKTSVDRGITLGRRMLPNLVVHKTNCEGLMDDFHNYEYTFIDKNNDWSPKPKHNDASHGMDCYRYCVMLLAEMAYLGINMDGSYPQYDESYDALSSLDLEPKRPKLSLVSKKLDVKKQEQGLIYPSLW